jgi:protein involved in polysaccharide export with SLBB domain
VRPKAVLYGERVGVPVLLYNAELSRRDLRRDARHLSLVGQLTDGLLSHAAFRARVRNWRPVTVLGPAEVAGEYRFLSDPDAVLALAERARGEEPEWIQYPNAALRRRRAV